MTELENKNISLEIGVMKNQIENVCKEITDFKIDYKEDIKDIKESLKSLDNKFAPKWVEWFAKISIGGMVTVLFGLLIYLLEK